jgi:DNA-binding LytR/AlgR family response regulator
MIQTIIIEDEKLIAAELKRLVSDVSPEINVQATLSSVAESVEYFSTNQNADLIFSDVQLPDGLSFDIFSRVKVMSPVIFITAYDQFIVNAFEHNGIDYLLKPVDERDLRKAFLRYKTLEKHFTGHQPVLDMVKPRKKNRLMVKKGIENIALKLDEVALLYTENKIVYVIDQNGRKYLADKNLSELELELDSDLFFRANRQYIINIGIIKSYKTYEKVKLEVDLLMPNLNHHIVISQETAPDFRKWISEL